MTEPTKAIWWSQSPNAYLCKVSGGLSSSSATVGLIRPACTSILQQSRENTDKVSEQTESGTNIKVTSVSVIEIILLTFPSFDHDSRDTDRKHGQTNRKRVCYSVRSNKEPGSMLSCRLLILRMEFWDSLRSFFSNVICFFPAKIPSGWHWLQVKKFMLG